MHASRSAPFQVLRYPPCSSYATASAATTVRPVRRRPRTFDSSSAPSSTSHHRSHHTALRALIPAKDGKLLRAQIPLREGSVYGHATSRGTRAYQEDTYSVSVLHFPTTDLRASLSAQEHSRVAQAAAKQWDDERNGGDLLAGQVLWFGCFDGHGGRAISNFLSAHLHALVEHVTPDMVTSTVQYTREHGGYFRRFRGGMLERWVRDDKLVPVRAGGPGGAAAAARRRAQAALAARIDGSDTRSVTSEPADTSASAAPSTPSSGTTEKKQEPSVSPAAPAAAAAAPPSSSPPKKRGEPIDAMDDAALMARVEALTESIPPPSSLEKAGALPAMTLGERATLSWLIADRLIQADEGLNVGGSTASVAMLYSLDTPVTPWYSSKVLALTIAHVGDTRMLLCQASDGRAVPLTTHHHPDDRSEAERLRKLGAGMITDSFGEARWMGALANTRAFGDSQYKKVGVTPEPEIVNQVVRGDDYAFLIGFSDGVGGVMSDQEIVDLCRDAKHPTDAAKAVLKFAEELGSEDNCTVVCVPLRGWGKIGGEDTTKQRREFRRSKVDIFRDGRM